ncbi:MAG TPA: c-type cytochrome [Vicinamibacteria bacterium]|nr:c-type cytochrome [Vicinamibacteria bacterium]
MMRRSMILLAMVAIGSAGAAVAAEKADPAKGKAVMSSVSPKCTGCHTDAKNPLAKAGAENSEADLKAWIRTPKEQMTKKGKTGMMPAYSPEKISDADLDALVAYLATMK